MSELKLFPSQLTTLTKLMANSRFMDLSEAGTGKTAPACTFTMYKVKHLNEKVIWIQPNSIIFKNRQELLLWTGLKEHEIQIIKGTPAQKHKIALDPNVKIWLMSAESYAKYHSEMYEKFPEIKHVICDESHLYYRGWTSKRTQAFAKSMDKRKDLGVTFLTATPTPRGKLSSAYVYCHTIQRNYYQHYDYFINYHAVVDDYGNPSEWVNPEKLNTFMKNYSIAHTKKEVYGDVPMFIVREPLELDPKHEAFYRQYEAEGILDLESSVVTGSTGGVASLRARQILNQPHNLKLPMKWDDKGKVIEYSHHQLLTSKDKTNKELRLIELLEEGERIVIFAVFQAEQERILQLGLELGLRGAIINGNVSLEKRGKIDQDFRDGKLDFVVASPLTAGVGFNWGFLNTIVYHSMDYGDDDFVQSYHRGLRGFRTQPLRILILEYAETIEQTVLWKIHHNSRVSHSVNKTSPIITFPSPVGSTEKDKYCEMTGNLTMD